MPRSRRRRTASARVSAISSRTAHRTRSSSGPESGRAPGRGVTAVRQAGAPRPRRRTTRSTARSRDGARGRVLDPLEAHEAREAVLGLVIVQARPCREARRAAPARDEPLVDEGGGRPLDPGPGEGAGGFIEERHGVGGGRTGGLVRRADDRAPLPGHEEEEAALALRPHRAGHHRRAAQHHVAGAQERRGRPREAAARQDARRPRARPRSRPCGRGPRSCPRRACRAPRHRRPCPRSAGGRRPPRGSPRRHPRRRRRGGSRS